LDNGFEPLAAVLVFAALASIFLASPVMAEETMQQAPASTETLAPSADQIPSPGDTRIDKSQGSGVAKPVIEEVFLIPETGKEAQALSVEEIWVQDIEPAPVAIPSGAVVTGDSPVSPTVELPVETGEAVGGEKEAPGMMDNSGPRQIEPVYVRELTGVQKGRNDSNPVWSPSGGRLAFERSVKERKEIVIARPDGSILSRIYMQEPREEGALDFFLPDFLQGISYNSGITWSPTGDRFVFMSNGGTGNYDLYLSGLPGDSTTRLTSSSEKDGHARWSPVAEQIVFVSGRSGKADLYLLDLTTLEMKPLTRGEKTYLYPEWSPDGTRIAMIYGSNENHDIYIIDDAEQPFETIRPLTTWDYDDLRPTWSPDGRHIAFYSNYNLMNDPKIWSLMVVSADDLHPTETEGSSLRIVARNVNPDMERGPAWMPDSRRILYVEDNRHEFFPIRVVDIQDGSNMPLNTNTKINHDVVCSSDGTIAFRAQVEQWDHIFLARLEEPAL
jgi:Tol biopolymer transport system component